jgi:hypothetical protein
MTAKRSTELSQEGSPPNTETLTEAERFARAKAAIEAKIQAKRAAYAKPRPAAGRRAQELDSEAVGPQMREKGTTLTGPHYPRVPSR